MQIRLKCFNYIMVQFADDITMLCNYHNYVMTSVKESWTNNNQEVSFVNSVLSKIYTNVGNVF